MQILRQHRKHSSETMEKNTKSSRNPLQHDEKKGADASIYYNIIYPSNKVQCDQCKRDVSKVTKILAQDCDYCVSCFSNVEEHINSYHVINKLDFPLFDPEWTADEELLLFEGLEKHGFGNWGEIADFIGTNKTRQQVEEHYQSIYLDNPDFVPITPVISKRDKEGKITKGNVPKRRQIIAATRRDVASTIPFQRGSITVHQQTNSSIKTGSNPAEIVGYMPKRGDFEVEYDNDAELLLAEMEFNDDDSEEEKRMKFRLIDIYNQKLNQRIRRKEFVISRKLLDLKEQMRLDKARTKEEKQIYNMMKVFARFSMPQEHQKLVQGIIREKQIRQRIEELKELKKKGFRTLGEVEEQLQTKKKKDEKNRKKEQVFTGNDKSKTRRMRLIKDQQVQKQFKRVIYLTKEEEELCRKFNITHKQYMMIKETIIRESVRQGIIEKDQTSKMFKIQRHIIDGVFDFLVEREDVIAKDHDTSEMI